MHGILGVHMMLMLAVQVLVYCFRTLLAIAHPLIPFVTERLWTTLPAQQQQLLISSQWPSHEGAVDQQALSQYQVSLIMLLVVKVSP